MVFSALLTFGLFRHGLHVGVQFNNVVQQHEQRIARNLQDPFKAPGCLVV